MLSCDFLSICSCWNASHPESDIVASQKTFSSQRRGEQNEASWNKGAVCFSTTDSSCHLHDWELRCQLSAPLPNIRHHWLYKFIKMSFAPKSHTVSSETSLSPSPSFYVNKLDTSDCIISAGNTNPLKACTVMAFLKEISSVAFTKRPYWLCQCSNYVVWITLGYDYTRSGHNLFKI